jgi:hypothetical protein
MAERMIAALSGINLPLFVRMLAETCAPGIGDPDKYRLLDEGRPFG